ERDAQGSATLRAAHEVLEVEEGPEEPQRQSIDPPATAADDGVDAIDLEATARNELDGRLAREEAYMSTVELTLVGVTPLSEQDERSHDPHVSYVGNAGDQHAAGNKKLAEPPYRAPRVDQVLEDVEAKDRVVRAQFCREIHLFDVTDVDLVDALFCFPSG